MRHKTPARQAVDKWWLHVDSVRFSGGRHRPPTGKSLKKPLRERVVISAVMPTYARADVVFERGEGAYLYDTGGRRYLDFASGVAVTALGHAHPRLIQALTAQAHKVWHTSNLFRVAGQERVAERLIRHSFADTVSSATPAPRRGNAAPSSSAAIFMTASSRGVTASSPAPAAFMAARWRRFRPPSRKSW